MSSSASAKRRGLAVVAFVYALALTVGWMVFRPALGWVAGLLPSSAFPWSILAAALVADVVATVVVFAASLLTRNSSLYDPYWSVAPVALAILFVGQGLRLGIDVWEHSARILAALVLVNLWGHRLTFSWARGWRGLSHEDWRYVDLQQSCGRFYWPVSFLGIHLMPTLLTFLGSVPLYVVILLADRPFGLIDVLGIGVAAKGIIFETVADKQLHAFRQTNPPQSAILETGIWRYSRHPNYLGEITFWWGLWLLGVAALPSAVWTVAGALLITLLFAFVSIPMIDRRMLARRPGYQERMRRVSALVPLPPRSPSSSGDAPPLG